MNVLIQKLFAGLLFLLFSLLDGLQDIFKILCGLPTTDSNGTEYSSITDIFLGDNIILKAFVWIFIISIFVIGIACFVSVIKSIIASGEKRKPHLKTVGQGFGAMLTSLVMAIVMLVGITVSNGILAYVDLATSPNNGKEELTISQNIFSACVEGDKYTQDFSKPKYGYVYDEHGNVVFETDVYGNTLYALAETVETNEKIFDEEGNPIGYRCETKLDEHGNVVFKLTYPEGTTEEEKKYLPGSYVLASEGDEFAYPAPLRKIVGYEFMLTSTPWWEKSEGVLWRVSDINFSQTSVDQVFGVRQKDWPGIFENSSARYTSNPMIEFGAFNMLVAYIAVIILVISFGYSMLGLVKRLYDFVMLFLMLPLISATIPLDDGARFKAWREAVVSKVVLAYGAVLSVNIFTLLMPTILSLTFFGSGFINSLFRLFLLIGGGLAINGGQLLMARVMGTSAEENREMANSARALMTGGMAAAGGIGAVGRLAFGGTNRYGKQVSGIIPGVAKSAFKVGAGAVNVAGNVLGGQAYRNAVGSIGGAVGTAGAAVSGAFKGLTTAKNVGAPGTKAGLGSQGGIQNVQGGAFSGENSSKYNGPQAPSEQPNSVKPPQADGTKSDAVDKASQAYDAASLVLDNLSSPSGTNQRTSAQGGKEDVKSSSVQAPEPTSESGAKKQGNGNATTFKGKQQGFATSTQSALGNGGLVGTIIHKAKERRQNKISPPTIKKPTGEEKKSGIRIIPRADKEQQNGKFKPKRGKK